MQSKDLLTQWQHLAGTDLGVTDWLTIDQQRINSFAETTLDHQLIHIDPTAQATQNLGGTIAHGFLSLSLLSYLGATLTKPHIGDNTVLNYGLNRVRFINPVASGSDIRLHMKVLSAGENPQGVLVTFHSEVEIKNTQKPALIAEQLALFLYQ